MSIATELDTLKDSVLEFKDYLKNSDGQSTETRASLGNAESQFKMFEVSKTSEEKIKWLELSAENGNEKAYHYLGFEYAKIDKPKKSIKFYNKAIESNKTTRYTKPNLALNYIQKNDFRDLEKAEKILEEAREEEDFFFIDHCYGVLNFFKQDYEKAKGFFDKDGAITDLKSCYKCKMLLKGHGYEKDILKAIGIMSKNPQWHITDELIEAAEKIDI
jgi:tetratricopeptide (TPR) repeat protein